MGLLADVEENFKTTDLYLILRADKACSPSDLKKAYHKASLLFHPDRHSNADASVRRQMTVKFQILSRIYKILSEKESRKLYDTQGILADENEIDGDVNWVDYWRALFPKVTVSDIDKFIQSYVGSDEEREDLKRFYNQFNGDLDIIWEHMINYDEDRVVSMIQEMIDSDELKPLKAFTNEPYKKKQRRLNRIIKEERQAKKAKKEMDDNDDLVKAIQSRRKADYSSLIDKLEAKYAAGGSG